MNPSRPVLSLEELEAFDPHAPTGVRRRFCCPLCGQDKARDGTHRCLSVETSTGLWRCFRCELGGKLRDKWQDKPLSRRVQARGAMRQAFGLGQPASCAAPQAPLRVAEAPLLPDVTSGSSRPHQMPYNASTRFWHDCLRGLRPLQGSPGQNYLEGRGLPLEVCLAARVKFCPSWLGRPAVVFPVHDEQGTLVAAQGRYLDGREDPKARTLGQKKQGVFLSGGFWEQVKKGAPVIITEAPIDALSLAACGFPALALCGKSGVPSWLPLKCAFKTVVLALDADDAGEEGAAKLAPILESLGAKVRRLVPEGEKVKDWNQMLEEWGRERLDEWLCLHLLS